MTRSDFSEHVTVEITGGPPGTTVMVLVSGTPSKRVHLDGCGVGSVQVALTSGDSCVEIASGERVLLTGRLPAAGCVAGSRS